MILYISPDFLERYKESGDLLDSCFTNAENNDSHVLRVELFAKSRLYETLVELEGSLAQDDFASGLYQNTLFLQFLILLNRASMILIQVPTFQTAIITPRLFSAHFTNRLQNILWKI